MKAFLAIDPGSIGGLAWTGCRDPRDVVSSHMPDTGTDLVELIESLKVGAALEGNTLTAYVEKVGGFQRGGESRQPGSSMFKFGFGCGVIEGAVLAFKIPLIYVTPQKWQKHFSLGTAASCPSRTVWKNKLKAEAQRRYPQLKVTLATCDALLILSYARETCEQQTSISAST